MTVAVIPEMLWESADPDAELMRRFGFTSAEAVAAWAAQVLGDDYGLDVSSVDRLVLSAQNLMIWVTSEQAGRLMMKVCRLAVAHEWLSTRSALVEWLAAGDQPVAVPLQAIDGDRQLLRDGHSIGVQPILPGRLLDAADHQQVAAAGSALATLHNRMAEWPEAHRLAAVLPVAGSRDLWVFPEGHAEVVPADLRARLDRAIVDLPELPRQPIHADFRGANILSGDGGITGILDFEEARLDPAVVDLAHAVCLLGTWYRNWQPITYAAQRLFVDSYSQQRPLTEAEQTWLPPLVGWEMLVHGWWSDARRWLSA